MWPTVPPGAALRRRSEPLPFPLSAPGCVTYSLGRHGIFNGLRALGISPGDEVLVPAYTHGSEVEAVERAGGRCAFYAGTPDLEPDGGELESLLGSRTRALHLVHHLGFPQDAPRWREWTRERGLLLIEDAAPAWLGHRDGKPVGSFGDLAIFSLYKTVGVPDGGAAVSAADLPRPRARPPAGGLRRVVRRHGAWLAQRSRLAAAAGRRARGARPFDPEREFALGDPLASASAATRYLLPRLARPGIAEARRRNYRYLLDRLGEHVTPPFGGLSEEACPWLFPVVATDKEGLLRHLASRGVLALDYWSVAHPSLPAERFPDAAARRRSTVALPVHQELREEDLERIAAATAEWYAR